MTTNKPLHTELTGTIRSIFDTGKRFKSGGMDRHKYIIVFTDNYQAEYCLPVLTQIQVKEGQTVTYKIVFRVSQGDTIDIILSGQDTPTGKASGSMIGSNSMQGHPACVALTVAAQMGVRHGWEMDMVFAKADECMKWLLDRRDLEAYQF